MYCALNVACSLNVSRISGCNIWYRDGRVILVENCGALKHPVLPKTLRLWLRGLRRILWVRWVCKNHIKVSCNLVEYYRRWRYSRLFADCPTEKSRFLSGETWKKRKTRSPRLFSNSCVLNTIFYFNNTCVLSVTGIALQLVPLLTLSRGPWLKFT